MISPVSLDHEYELDSRERQGALGSIRARKRERVPLRNSESTKTPKTKVTKYRNTRQTREWGKSPDPTNENGKNDKATRPPSATWTYGVLRKSENPKTHGPRSLTDEL